MSPLESRSDAIVSDIHATHDATRARNSMALQTFTNHVGALVVSGIAGMYGFVFSSVSSQSIAASVTRLILAVLAHPHGVCRDP